MNSGTKSRLPIYAAVLFCFALCPMPAKAHLNSTGMGPIYDGLMHFLMSPEDFVPVLALALLAGLRGAAYGRRALFTLPAAWLLGGFVGISAAAANGNAMVSAIWFLLLGGLLALDTKLSLRLLTALAALLGLYSGYLNGTGMGSSAPHRLLSSDWYSLCSCSWPSQPHLLSSCARNGPASRCA